MSENRSSFMDRNKDAVIGFVCGAATPEVLELVSRNFLSAPLVGRLLLDAACGAAGVAIGTIMDASRSLGKLEAQITESKHE